jgi:N-acetylneuraminic acid mutarotase
MGAWITKAGLIHSRSEVAVGEVNGKMYVLGGYADGNVAQPLNEEYDPVSDTWRERAPLPRGGNHIAAVGLGGKLYAIGGMTLQNADAFADVSAYDPATDKWSSRAPLPQPLGSMAVVAVDGVIHAMGGAGGTTADNRHTLAVHYIYDPRT